MHYFITDQVSELVFFTEQLWQYENLDVLLSGTFKIKLIKTSAHALWETLQRQVGNAVDKRGFQSLIGIKLQLELPSKNKLHRFITCNLNLSVLLHTQGTN